MKTDPHRLNLPSYSLPILDSTEQDCPSEGIEEHEQKHAEDDKETLANWDTNSQHQHLERGMLPRDREKAQDHHHEADRIWQIILKQTNGISLLDLKVPHGCNSEGCCPQWWHGVVWYKFTDCRVEEQAPEQSPEEAGVTTAAPEEGKATLLLPGLHSASWSLSWLTLQPWCCSNLLPNYTASFLIRQ